MIETFATTTHIAALADAEHRKTTPLARVVASSSFAARTM